jgi:hypothetical protein
MDALGPIIRLADDHDMRGIALLRDWDVDEGTHTVFHAPTKLLFVIDYDQPGEGEWVRPSALSARVAHVCDGGHLPEPTALQRVGKDAIHAFVLVAEVCQVPMNPDDIPF